MKSDLSKAVILGNPAPVISCEKARSCRYVLVDVRSLAEYHSGTIPGAITIPLFNENERGVIGTLYKKTGKESAIDQGFCYAGDKLTALLAQFQHHGKGPFAIFCARGGMRSRAIVNLLNQSGIEAMQIEGGYKRFRTEVLKTVEKFAPPLIVIHGLTGTGKTRILQHLDNVIDLEELAQHRSSLFGSLDSVPRNQRDFEALLAEQTKTVTKLPFFVEGESRKIGKVFIPKAFATAMKKGVLVKVTASLKTRISRIIEDYPVDTLEKKKEIKRILGSLTRSMGKKRVEEMCHYLEEDNLVPLVRILLVEYYDKRYCRCMQNYRFSLELSSEDIVECAEKLTAFRKTLL